ncbi:periphilin-1-like [Thomomys bottae]
MIGHRELRQESMQQDDGNPCQAVGREDRLSKDPVPGWLNSSLSPQGGDNFQELAGEDSYSCGIRNISPSSSSAVPSSKVLDKPTRLIEKELAEAASKWAVEKLEKSDESNLPEISEFETVPAAPLIDQPEEPELNTTNGAELFEDSQLDSRSKAIASKTKEIEQVYQQDCETFGRVVKMLIEKDPSLEQSIQFALRQNLHEIGERCVKELKNFIAEYDNSAQDFGEPF